MNLCGAVMRQRCPSASFVCNARLIEHRFIITTRGVSSIVPALGSVVHGALWKLTCADEQALDAFEGAPIFYRQRRVTVETPIAGCVVAFAYVATNSQIGRPRPGYLDAVLAGAIERELPNNYIGEIASWSAPRMSAA